MGTCSSLRRRMMMSGGEETLPNYLCLTALEEGTFTFTIFSGVDTTDCQYIEYSTDGRNWVRTNNVASKNVVITTPTITEGGKVYWRGYGYKYSSVANNSSISHFSSTGTFSVSGNISSIILGTNFESATQYRRRYPTTHASNRGGLRGLFYYCIGLIDASGLVLPDIGYNYNYEFYHSLFAGCSGLTDASFDMPTIVTENSQGGNYSSMFYGCTSLVNVPQFKMTTVMTSEFNGMFTNCTSLVNAPDLSSITNNKGSCFYNMFYGCNNLTSPAKMWHFTTVTNNCFYGMYQKCSNLTESPVLSAEILATGCYSFMFYNCTNLRYIRMYATDISASGCISRWVEGLHNTTGGIFVKNINATWTTTGASGVPSRWTIIYYDPSEDKYYTSQDKSQECDDHGNPI